MSAASYKRTGLDLAAALLGKSRPLTTCPHCNGSGRWSKDASEPCLECDATGQVAEEFDEPDERPNHVAMMRNSGALGRP